MKRINHHAGLLDSDTDFVLRLLQKWKPRSFTVTEKKQEQDLLSWLKQQLPDVPVIAQYGIAKGKADIVIQDSHVIELKLGFDETSVGEFDRCIGQLYRYQQKWVNKNRGPVYLVVVGESDAEFRDLLHTWFKEIKGTSFMLPRFYLIEKTPTE